VNMKLLNDESLSNGSSGNRGVLGLFTSSEVCFGPVFTGMGGYSIQGSSQETWEEFVGIRAVD
jgi:hypothetical protein